MYGASLGIVFLMYAGVFYFAAWMIANDKLASNDFSDIFKVLFAIMFAAMTAGQSGAMAPDYADAKNAANRIFKLLEREVRHYVFTLTLFSDCSTFSKIYWEFRGYFEAYVEMAGPFIFENY